MTTPPRAAGPLRRLVRAVPRRLAESLLVRLASSFLTLALITVVLLAIAAYANARATLRDDTLERLRTVAVVKEDELNRWIDEQRADLVFIASLPALRSQAGRLETPPEGPADTAVHGQVQDLLDSAKSVALDVDELFILSAVGGRVAASTDPRRVGDYHVSDLYFQRGLTRTYVQNVFPSPVTGRPTITVATPIRDLGGHSVAVLAGHLDLGRVDRLLAERTGLGRTGEAYLVTQLNDFVSSERFGRPDARRGVHTEGVRRALSGADGQGLYTNYAGARVLGAWRWIAARQMALLVEMQAEEAFAPARRIVVPLLVLGFGAAFALTVGIWLIARKVTRPIMAVAGAAARVAGGDFDAIAPVVTRDEVGVLARAFNDMTARLRASYADLSRQIEETRRANQALEESQQLFHAIVDNSANLIVVLDTEARFLLVNRRFEELFGRRNPDVRGRRPAEVLSVDAAGAIEIAARTALAGRPVVERDAEILQGGAVRNFHFVAFPLVEAGHAPYGVGIVGMDLSERTRAEEERRQMEAGVQQAQKLESLGLLAGGIAHDFNNILTAIVGGASLALNELPPGSGARADIEQVVTAAERAAKLTRQMLAYAGRASFAIEIFDLNRVIAEMAELIAVSVPKQVHLVRDLAGAALAVRADRTQVSQVVLNLITNGAEATGERGGTVRIATALRLAGDLASAAYRFAPAPAASYVELTVEDDGCGMAREILDRIYDPFYSTKGSGRGLGLAAVLGIVKQSGGAIRVTSTPGAGTTFVVLLPATAELPAETPALVAPVPAPREAGTILLVEDEEMVRRAARRVLERAGYAVLEARDGREAVDIARAEGPRIDAVVLDVTMPVMGGAEAYRQMRGLGLAAPVIVSSGYDEAGTFDAFQGGAISFLQKPYRPEQLLARLKTMTATAAPGA